MVDDDEPWLQRLDGRMFALLFAAALVGWMFVIGMLGGLVAVLVLVAQGREPSSDALYEVLYTPLVLGSVTVVQMLGMAAVTLGLARARGMSWGASLALGGPRRGWMLLTALVAGASVGPLAGLVAQEVERIFEPLGIFSSAQLVEMGRALAEGPLLPRLPLLAAVLIGAPLVEELVFRGLLWSALAERMPPRAVWLVTSLAFAGYHMDPLHMVAILPTALVIGWLRLHSGSLWPGVLAHFANNVNGVLWILVLGPEAEQSVTLPLAAGCLLLTLLACAAMLLGREDPAIPG